MNGFNGNSAVKAFMPAVLKHSLSLYVASIPLFIFWTFPHNLNVSILSSDLEQHIDIES